VPRIKSDLVRLLHAAATQQLQTQSLEIDSRFAVTVMMVSGGYPGDYEKGKLIVIKKLNDSIVFHAGTKNDSDKLLTNGGRVLSITSFGKSIQEAVDSSYQQIGGIDFEGQYFRRDIGRDLM
jgi:phosphoribosylamine--glycine ligase